MNVELFNKVAPNGDGRVHGIMWNGEKVGGGKLPGSKGLVVQDGGWELENVDEDGLWELKGVDEDVDVLSAAELEVKHAGVEQELKMVQAEIVREKGCMGKVSRVMRQYWQMWA